LNLVSRHVGPFGKELASFAVSDQFLSVGDRGWLVKTYSEGLPDQCSGGSVVAAGPGMYVI